MIGLLRVVMVPDIELFLHEPLHFSAGMGLVLETGGMKCMPQRSFDHDVGLGPNHGADVVGRLIIHKDSVPSGLWGCDNSDQLFRTHFHRLGLRTGDEGARREIDPSLVGTGTCNGLP